MKKKSVRTFMISALSLSIINAYAADNPKNSSSVVFMKAIQHDLSRPLKEMQGQPTIHTTLQTAFKRFSHNTPFNDSVEDGALNTAKPIQTLIPLTLYQGMGIDMPGYTVNNLPADSNGSIGLTQYVQLVNNDIAIYDKTTGLLAPGFPKPATSIWTGFGGACEFSNDGQAIVKFDQLANRWVISSSAAYDGSSPNECIAVSKTGDATGAYYRYRYSFTYIGYQPRLGLWPDAYYISYVDKPGPRICALDRKAFIAGQNPTMECFGVSYNDTSALLPVDLDGQTPPPSNAPGYFMGFKAPNYLTLYKFYVDFVNPKNATFSGPTNIFVANFKPACAGTSGDKCAVQPIASTKLDTQSDSLMHRLAYRQFPTYGSLVITHTVEGPLPKKSPAPRWYELRFPLDSTTPSVIQQATNAPDSLNRYIGSIATDKAGNIAIGYTISSTLINPSPEFAWRAFSDPLNTMGNIQPLVTSLGSQTKYSGWGSFNSLSIDPADDCTFWYTNQYLLTTGSFNWSTGILKFKLPGCV